MAAVVVWPATAARAPDRLAYGKHGKALRWHIVALYIDWALSCVTIAALLNGPVVHRKLISSKTVQRILDIFYANLDQGRRPSRTRNIPDPIWDFILQTIAIDPDLFLDEIQRLVKTNYNYTVPISTLCRNSNDAGLTVRVLQLRSIDRYLQAEQDWARLATTHDPRMFIFIDYIHQIRARESDAAAEVGQLRQLLSFQQRTIFRREALWSPECPQPPSMCERCQSLPTTAPARSSKGEEEREKT
jgi:hypothetical protein|tara:strand:- start:58 stop:792 length:735 start_codon:yes stop_codon:yes gene_type:complete